ncbi:GNAT family N-acetyltransferase [Arcticibacterium luteifluviistationis]|uniref:GNAT family N-acetyltransferase n=1 Tax=Arcticibacterium luteifluviistationis TaxID=1784714 RepID=A0A2Z4G9G5_9BACT|nr:GNAT family N-acetyltransferase [Arcticibacterium luteifluviistationis]AWV97708.1 GNAT family N-acetyltransferase [Arcticibacterium luteifluviistationis]
MISLRKATIKELPIIQSLAKEIWPATFGQILSKTQLEYMLDMMYSLASLKKQLSELNHVFIIVSEAGKDIGYLSYELNVKNESITKIHKIYLHPSTQGKGYGKELIAYAKKIAIENKQRALTLNVNKYNKAYNFYLKQGFVLVKNEDIDIGQGFLMEDAVLSLSLA